MQRLYTHSLRPARAPLIFVSVLSPLCFKRDQRVRTGTNFIIWGQGCPPLIRIPIHSISEAERQRLRKMGVNSVPSESSNDLNEQIEQLMQCKPLSEQQVQHILHLFNFLNFVHVRLRKLGDQGWIAGRKWLDLWGWVVNSN